MKNEIKTACIVMPTYNEAMNIAKMLDRVFKLVSRQKSVDLHVLVVDDNSPDGTSEVVRLYSKQNPRVHLLLRKKKEGLGKAYIAGMSHALKTINPDVILEMDADGQHDPSDIFRLIGEVNSGADFVIGSRYVNGGSIPNNWGLGKRFKSICANAMTKLLLGTWGVKDCSGGFRAIRSELLRMIEISKLNVRGYAFQAVLLEEAIHNGGLVSEIPIAFNNRENGETKMSVNDMLEGFSVFARVRIKRTLRPLAFRKPKTILKNAQS